MGVRGPRVGSSTLGWGLSTRVGVWASTGPVRTPTHGCPALLGPGDLERPTWGWEGSVGLGVGKGLRLWDGHRSSPWERRLAPRPARPRDREVSDRGTPNSGLGPAGSHSNLKTTTPIMPRRTEAEVPRAPLHPVGHCCTEAEVTRSSQLPSCTAVAWRKRLATPAPITPRRIEAEATLSSRSHHAPPHRGGSAAPSRPRPGGASRRAPRVTVAAGGYPAPPAGAAPAEGEARFGSAPALLFSLRSCPVPARRPPPRRRHGLHAERRGQSGGGTEQNDRPQLTGGRREGGQGGEAAAAG